MTGIFLTAVCLGAAYNSISPLGIRTAERVEPVPAVAPVIPDPALRNETITATLVPTGEVPEAAKLIAGLSWAEVKPLLAAGKIVLVDAREAAAFETDHIPGAVSLPLRELDEKLAAFVAKVPKTQPVVTFCGNIGCPLAHVLAVRLSTEHGYTDVREMPGGYVE